MFSNGHFKISWATHKTALSHTFQPSHPSIYFKLSHKFIGCIRGDFLMRIIKSFLRRYRLSTSWASAFAPLRQGKGIFYLHQCFVWLCWWCWVVFFQHSPEWHGERESKKDSVMLHLLQNWCFFAQLSPRSLKSHSWHLSVGLEVSLSSRKRIF